MKKTIMAISLAILTTTANAGFEIKQSLEQSGGGSLPNNSIEFRNSGGNNGNGEDTESNNGNENNGETPINETKTYYIVSSGRVAGTLIITVTNNALSMYGTNDTGRDYVITIGSQTYTYPDGRTTLEGTYNGETLSVAAGGRIGKFCNNGDGTDCQDTVVIN